MKSKAAPRTEAKAKAAPKPKAKKRKIVEALLDEYAVVLEDLKAHIRTIEAKSLARVVDEETSNPDCKSIQSILTHVVYCGRQYLRMIDLRRGNAEAPAVKRVRLESAQEYCSALDELHRDTCVFFENIGDADVVRHDPEDKIVAGWGQIFDIEQLMEHAIVHVSRHRRQIQGFKKSLGLRG